MTGEMGPNMFGLVWSVSFVLLLLLHCPVVLTDGMRSSQFILTKTAHILDPQSVAASASTPTKLKCAHACLSRASCAGFSFDSASSPSCLMTYDVTPVYLPHSSGTSFVVRGAEQHDGSNESTQIYATTPDTNDVSTQSSDVTTEASAPCTPVSASGSLQACSAAQVRHVKAAMRLNSNKAAIFLDDGTYLVCNTVDDIQWQHCGPCTSKILAGNANRDPDGVFATGPDAALEYNHPTASQSKYFLIKGDTVYCYQHNSTSPYFELCTSGWQSMNVQARFGAGIPSSPDAAMGSWAQWTFYFVKNGIVYTSAGTSSSGSLQGTPGPVHDVFPSFPCDSTAMMEGMNQPEKFFFEGHKHFFRNGGGTLYLRGQVCK